MGHSKVKNTSAAVSRAARAAKRGHKRKIEEVARVEAEVADSLINLGNVDLTEKIAEPIPDDVVTENEKECQTTLTMKDMEMQELYLKNATSELSDLKRRLLGIELGKAGFENDDEKTKFYTGIPNFIILMHVFDLVSPDIKSAGRNALSQFQEFLLVLMKMKLNLPLQDLGYRFGISVSTVRIFCKWIDQLSIRLRFLIHWPDREELRSTMPSVFKQNFKDKVVVIIDCFEVFIERPSSLIARAMTWSNYKHHNTIKFLIGITPQGSTSFISKAWGGRVSDKYLTEQCGMLRKLLPGDIVLADRGFDIADSVGFYQAKLYIPAFTKGKTQLSTKEVEQTRKIANVRIHVERVIGLVRRKYVILQSILPIEYVTVKKGDSMAPIDKIVVL